jgi:hypothetical protein
MAAKATATKSQPKPAPRALEALLAQRCPDSGSVPEPPRFCSDYAHLVYGSQKGTLSRRLALQIGVLL